MRNTRLFIFVFSPEVGAAVRSKGMLKGYLRKQDGTVPVFWGTLPESELCDCNQQISLLDYMHKPTTT